MKKKQDFFQFREHLSLCEDLDQDLRDILSRGFDNYKRSKNIKGVVYKFPNGLTIQGDKFGDGYVVTKGGKTLSTRWAGKTHDRFTSDNLDMITNILTDEL